MAKKITSETVKATAEKAVEKATETSKAVEVKAKEVEEKAKETSKKVEAKAKEVVEEVVEKVPAAKAVADTVAEKAPAAKAAAKKASTKAKETTKKASAKAKETTKKAVEKIIPVEETYFEINGEQIQAEKIVAAVKEAYKAEGHRLTSIKSLQTYVNPAEHKAYYVINGNAEGKYVEF